MKLGSDNYQMKKIYIYIYMIDNGAIHVNGD